MGIPFQVPAEGMQDHEKPRSKMHGLVLLGKHTGNNTAYSMEKAVKQCAVVQEKLPEALVDGKDAVPVGNINQMKGHRGSALHGVFIAAGRAETAVTAEGDKFEFPAGRAAVHGAAEGGVTTMDHFVDVFHNSRPGMKFI